MANSKANIYPVQLQNAELNLNRFDAEIKPYSGFNKNNAPFVGGCLSNIFTKKQSYINGNNKNTYIDNEDHVYKLSYVGYGLNSWILGKDQTFVLSGHDTQFLVNNKLSFPMDAVKILNNELYVRSQDNVDAIYYQILGTNNIKFRLASSPTGTPYPTIDLLYYTGKEVEKFQQNCITSIFVSPSSSKNYCIVAAVRFGSFVITAIDMDPVIENGVKIYNYFRYSVYYPASVSVNEPVAICWDEEGTKQFSFFFSQNDNSFKFAEFFNIDFTNFTIAPVGNEFNLVTSISNDILSSGEKLCPQSLISYHILSYPENKCILTRQIISESLFNITDNTAFKIVGRLQTPYLEDGKLKFRNKTVIDYTAVKTVASSYYMKIGEFLETNDSTRTPRICSCDIQNAVSETYNDTNYDNFKTWIVHQTNDTFAMNGFHFVDYDEVRNLKVIKRGSYALGDFTPIGKGLFYFAMNNNLLSAICSKYVLLTEWNSIDAKNVYFYNDYRSSKKILGNFDERIYYKVNNDWFEIRLEEEPSFQVFGNQLVVNVNTNKNSYDMKRNKILHFATPYNSIIDGYHRKTNGTLYSLFSQDNTYYVGAAVRPYKQEDNSSIILNPVNIAVQSGGNYKYARHFLAVHFDEFVDIFSNVKTGNTEINYDYSARWNGSSDEFKVDIDLLNMPYPIDTNGNVEYNVNLFSKIMSTFGTAALIKSQLNSYPLVVGNNNNILMNYYLASGVEGLNELFVIQSSYYGILNGYICSLYYNNGVVSGIQYVVNIEGLQYCGNTPYEALFYSPTNKCLYSFTGANVLNVKQFVDKIDEVRSYKYNPATQSIFLITDIGVIVSSLFGVYVIEMTDAQDIYLLDNGIVLSDNNGNYRYIKYYKKDIDEDYLKENIHLETCFYGTDNQTVTINDCLYFRLFSEEHEEGELKVSATTLSLKGRKTEQTTFNIKASDWDKITHTIYIRYQPKEQRGLGVSFSIDSPFKIASLSIGSQPDAILVDKISKGAINAPFTNKGSTIEW